MMKLCLSECDSQYHFKSKQKLSSKVLKLICKKNNWKQDPICKSNDPKWGCDPFFGNPWSTNMYSYHTDNANVAV